MWEVKGQLWTKSYREILKYRSHWSLAKSENTWPNSTVQLLKETMIVRSKHRIAKAEPCCLMGFCMDTSREGYTLCFLFQQGIWHLLMNKKGRNYRQDSLVWGQSRMCLPLKCWDPPILRGLLLQGQPGCLKLWVGPRTRVCSVPLEAHAFSARMFSSCVITVMVIF